MKKWQLMVMPAPPSRSLWLTVGAVVAASALWLLGLGVPRADAGERHFELVTPVEKLGQEPRFSGITGAVSPDGQSVSYDIEAGNGLPGATSHYANINSYGAQRTASGWVNSSWNPSAIDFTSGTSGYADLTPDFAARLFNLSTAEQNRNGESAYYLRRSPGDSPERISPVLRVRQGASKFSRPDYRGATPDLSHILLSMVRGYTLRDEDPPATVTNIDGRNLYEIANAGTADAVLRRVDLDDAGQVLGPKCGAFFGAAAAGQFGRVDGSISSDGRRIFFSAFPGGVNALCGTSTGGPRARVYARVDGTSTVEVSASECDRTPDAGAVPPIEACATPVSDAQYESASADGRRVWFSTADQLVDGDVDGDPDLYVYDFDAPAGQRLTRVSSKAGATAGFQTFVRAAADGSRGYFLATGVLAGNENAQQATAVDGQSNLYAYDVASGVPTFVATIDAADAALWAGEAGLQRRAQVGDEGGRILVFSTAAPVTVDDTDAVSDVFRFDAEDQSLSRVSTGQPGRGNSDTGPAQISGNGQTDAAGLGGSNRFVSRDGTRIIFTSPERLTNADTNDVVDVYEWHDGEVQLVSDGRPPERGQEGFPIRTMMSTDGSTVVFITPRSLVAQDRDTSVDIYAARLGDDVQVPAEPELPNCAGAACQEPSAPMADPPAPQTPLFTGPGNLVAPPTVTASISQVKKPGSIRGSRATLRVTVTGAGRLTTAGTGLRSTSRTVAKAGTYAVAVTLTKRAALTLRRKGQVRATVRLTLTAKGGTPAVARSTVTFNRTKQQQTKKRQAAAKRSAS